ncbi:MULTISPECIES: YcgL domain-containing protein [Larsenimonas]|uniref:YcgL domain-containing protein QC825_12385 n=1 Tax=Larsenimonas suaedae TaxID=1851019 RepID=A0ABU1GXU5_9GAMM|nr:MULTISPECIES: YcgL domain-containing protein [Larsenimonas]MCM2972774.1 YcgL domain-containing protein [Larsenimonas suaedae]MCM5705748.1 YcgL domain-containing protein [Larsenimonas salina]MDR5896873.1 YcgL domain-containing protein [Larsenimonas suaedae]
MNEPFLCDVYKSPRRDEMYLYVRRGDDLKELPEALAEHFGTPVFVMPLLMTRTKTLARTTGAKVLDAIMSQGFYLQMPPAKEPGMLDLYRTPTEGRY